MSIPRFCFTVVTTASLRLILNAFGLFTSWSVSAVTGGVARSVCVAGAGVDCCADATVASERQVMVINRRSFIDDFLLDKALLRTAGARVSLNGGRPGEGACIGS